MGSIWIWVPEKISKRNDGPGIAAVNEPLSPCSWTIHLLVLEALAEELHGGNNDPLVRQRVGN